MVSTGLTNGDRALILRRHQRACVVMSVMFNLISAVFSFDASWHLINILFGLIITAPTFAVDEKLLLRGAWNMQGIGWRDFLARGSHEFYFDTQSPFWSWIVCQSPRFARGVTTLLSAIAFELLAQHLLTVSFLLAATPIILFMRSGIQHDIVAFDLILIGVLIGGAWGGALVGAGIVTKYYFAPAVLLCFWTLDFRAASVACLVCLLFFVWLSGTHFYYVQRRFLTKLLTGGARKSITTPLTHLSWRGTSRRALIFAAYLFPLLAVINSVFLLGFAAALYVLAQPKYLLLLGLTILC